jgi:Ras-related protein Rab-18
VVTGRCALTGVFYYYYFALFAEGLISGMAAAAPLAFKLLLVGDSGVGKSSILLRFTDGEFDDEQPVTIGVDFRQRRLNLQGTECALTLWDTAGQEKFRSLTSSYYRGTHGVCLVYDSTSRTSFENLERWLDEARLYCSSEDVVMLLVGNKIDRSDHRQVSENEGTAFAAKHGMLFIECSAKTQVGIQQVFEELVRKILERPRLWDPDAQKRSQGASPSGGVSLDGGDENEGACGGYNCVSL